MSGVVQSAANRGDISDDSRGSLIVQHQHRLDPAVCIRAQLFLDFLGRNRSSVGNLDLLHLDAVGGSGVAEALAEVAVDAA